MKVQRAARRRSRSSSTAETFVFHSSMWMLSIDCGWLPDGPPKSHRSSVGRGAPFRAPSRRCHASHTAARDSRSPASLSDQSSSKSASRASVKSHSTQAACAPRSPRSFQRPLFRKPTSADSSSVAKASGSCHSSTCPSVSACNTSHMSPHAGPVMARRMRSLSPTGTGSSVLPRRTCRTA
eukprot:7384130-Prymnesium_polylepis.1